MRPRNPRVMPTSPRATSRRSSNRTPPRMRKKSRSVMRESLVDGELTRAISAYPGARHKLLMPAAKQKVDLREVGGKLRSVVLDDKGEPRLKQGAKTADEYMEPADLVAEMRNDKEYAGAFPASSGRVTDSRTLQPTPMGGGNATERAQMATIMAEIATGASKLSG